MTAGIEGAGAAQIIAYTAADAAGTLTTDPYRTGISL
jgi:hypothetical protein